VSQTTQCVARATQVLKSSSAPLMLATNAQVLMTTGKPGDWDKWVSMWVNLIKAVQQLPATSNGAAVIDYCIVDIMNEPECTDNGQYNMNLK